MSIGSARLSERFYSLCGLFVDVFVGLGDRRRSLFDLNVPAQDQEVDRPLSQRSVSIGTFSGLGRSDSLIGGLVTPNDSQHAEGKLVVPSSSVMHDLAADKDPMSEQVASSISSPHMPELIEHTIDISIYENIKFDNNFVRRISSDDWNKFTESMDKYEGRALKSDEVMAFKIGNWNHPIFKETDWALLAFHLYLAGILDENTICKLFLYNACQKQLISDTDIPGRYVGVEPKLTEYQLYNSSGNVDIEAKNYLRGILGKYLNDQEFEAFCNRLKDLPPEQTQFFNIYRSMDQLLFTFASPSIFSVQPLTFDFGHEPIKSSKKFHAEGTWTNQFVASPEFVYHIHCAKFGENAIRPAPHLGFSADEYEAMIQKDSRVVSIPAPFVTLPPIVHDAHSTELTIYFHDVSYHHAIDSANTDREIWIEFASYLKTNQKRFGISEKELYAALDREFVNYARHKKGGRYFNFWLAFYVLANVKNSNISNAFIDFYKENPRLQCISGLTFESFDEFEKDRKRISSDCNFNWVHFIVNWPQTCKVALNF